METVRNELCLRVLTGGLSIKVENLTFEILGCLLGATFARQIPRYIIRFGGQVEDQASSRRLSALHAAKV